MLFWYRRQLECISHPDGKVQPFVMYSVQGFRDTLRAQAESIRDIHADVLWRHYIHETFRDKTSPADLRREELALELSRLSEPVPLSRMQKAIPGIAMAYTTKTYKTLTRDVNVLITLGLVEKTGDGIIACKGKIRAFKTDKG